MVLATLVALLAVAAFPGSDAIAATWQPVAETESSSPRGPLKIRQGRPGDRFLTAQEQAKARKNEGDEMGGLPFMTLTEVLNKVRNSLPNGFGTESTIINVGAAFKDVDPIYDLDMATTYPQGYNLIGYECDHLRVPYLAKKRSDVVIREMCVTGPKIVKDMRELNVEERFSLVKTDIDSVDGPVLDSILREYKPYVVYSEIMWDFAPPVEFTLVKVEGAFNPFTGGCFGMSISMVDHIFRRNGYRLIEAAHANVIAVHEDVAYLFEDRPQDPWFWYQATKSGLYHSHWLGGGLINATTNSPLSLYGEGLGLYDELLTTDGKDNFGKPPVGIRTMDITMARIAERVAKGCNISGVLRQGNAGHKYMLAVGDRCCAPQWGKLDNCVCEFPETAEDARTRAN